MRPACTTWFAGAAIALLSACGDPAPRFPVRTAGPAPTGIDPALLGPLTALGPCPPPPAALSPPPDASAAVLPDEAVVTGVEESGPLTTFTGVVALSPVQLRVHYQRDEPAVVVLSAEDEVRESEVLFTGGDQRIYVKAQAICEAASQFLAIVTDDSAASALPTLPNATPAAVPTG